MAEVKGSRGWLKAGYTSEDSPPLPPGAPPGEPGQARRPDTALNRVRHGAGRAHRAAQRGTLAAELLVVLAVFPLPAVIAAVILLTARIQLGISLPFGFEVPVRGSWLWATLQISDRLAQLAGAALVCYLLARSGESLAAIGLGRRTLRMDLALVLPVFIVVQYVPQTFGSDLLRWLHLQGFDLSVVPLLQNPAALTAAQVTAGVVAGIVEEIVVLGYLVRRLEQLGLRSSWVVVIAVLVRVSYHLYYGWNAVPIALWALASVLFYLRIRRLLPFILCHIAWDVAIPFRAFYSPAYQVMLAAAIVASTCVAIWWGRRPASTADPHASTP